MKEIPHGECHVEQGLIFYRNPEWKTKRVDNANCFPFFLVPVQATFVQICSIESDQK